MRQGWRRLAGSGRRMVNKVVCGHKARPDGLVLGCMRSTERWAGCIRALLLHQTARAGEAHLSMTTSRGSTGPSSALTPAGHGTAPPPTSSNHDLEWAGRGRRVCGGAWHTTCCQSLVSLCASAAAGRAWGAQTCYAAHGPPPELDDAGVGGRGQVEAAAPAAGGALQQPLLRAGWSGVHAADDVWGRTPVLGWWDQKHSTHACLVCALPSATNLPLPCCMPPAPPAHAAGRCAD